MPRLTFPPIHWPSLAMAIALLGTAAAAFDARHSRSMAIPRQHINLAEAVPEQIGDWRHDPSFRQPSIGSAEGSYAQVLERVYVDNQGRHVMLSIAYGDNQLGDQLQTHRPEFCYQAQGFVISRVHSGTLAVRDGQVPVRRMEAARSGRAEPVTYWLTIGDTAVLPGFSRKLAQFRHILAGTVPGGALIRISSVNIPAAVAFAAHDDFARELVSQFPDSSRSHLAGQQSGT